MVENISSTGGQQGVFEVFYGGSVDSDREVELVCEYVRKIFVLASTSCIDGSHGQRHG